MRLRDWLGKTNVQIKSMAERLGMSLRSVHNVLSGSDMYLSTAMKIEMYTKKEVTCQELLSQEIINKLLKDFEIANQKIAEKKQNNHQKMKN